ncbi:MAG: hypothetical protein JKY01_03615 [Pseudomonadales bacterium]|nr:hypothetical protein [Pseudomonadales bacterium]
MQRQPAHPQNGLIWKVTLKLGKPPVYPSVVTASSIIWPLSFYKTQHGFALKKRKHYRPKTRRHHFSASSGNNPDKKEPFNAMKGIE